MQHALPVIIRMALWQMVDLVTPMHGCTHATPVYTHVTYKLYKGVSKCTSSHKTVMAMSSRAYCIRTINKYTLYTIYTLNICYHM